METYKVNVDGKERELIVVKPGGDVYNEADKVRSRVLFESLQQGLPTMVELENILIKRNVWSEDKKQQSENINKEIADKEYELSKGNMKLDDARKLAIEIRKLRIELKSLRYSYSTYFNNSAEGQAENEHFNYLVSRCIIYSDTKTPYFKNYEDYKVNGYTEIALWGAAELAKELYNIGKNAEKGNVENEFLIRFGMVNENLQLVDNDGNLVDEDGNRINEFGNKIDKDGNVIDASGRARDENYKPIVEPQPFFNDDGTVAEEKKKPE